MTALDTAVLDISPYRVAPGRLITAPSYLLDRFVPACEIIALPEKQVEGGRLELDRGAVTLVPEPSGGRLRRLTRRKTGARRIAGGTLFDFRLRNPDNWAHILNNHLPIFFRACAEFGLPWSETVILLPEDSPGYIRAALDLFGLKAVLTDDIVTGDGVAFCVSPWTAVRPDRPAWVRTPEIRDCLDRLTGDADLPERVFLARRSTRAISNMAEIEAWLTARGFTTVYPEDLSAPDQMRLFRVAEEIVAIHGAALAPLLYHRPDHRLKRLIEILPCGHMTDVYRVMADQVGVDWIGVRGRIKPEHVGPAYDFTKEFRKFSLESFHVDPASLDLAFSIMKENAHA